jgi:hypothetical protein
MLTKLAIFKPPFRPGLISTWAFKMVKENNVIKNNDILFIIDLLLNIAQQK